MSALYVQLSGRGWKMDFAAQPRFVVNKYQSAVM